MPETAACIIQHREGGYLHRTRENQLTRVSSREQATIFKSQKAHNLINSSIRPDQRKKWEIIAVEDPTQTARQITAIIPSSDLPQSELRKTTGNVPCNLPKGPVDLTQLVQQQQAQYTAVQTYAQTLPQALKTVEQEIFDLLHYIEFANLNAAEGYRVYSMLKDCRLRRRKIKNDMAKLMVLENATKEDLLSGKLAASMLAIDQEQVYHPRQLTDLFAKIS